MKKTNLIVMAMLLMGLAFFVNMDTASAASSVYVNVSSGDDKWDGSSQFYVNGTIGPKKTINGGVTVVDANGTVNIANGVYTGNGNNRITIGKNMTIKGQSKDGTIINGSNSDKIFTISNGFDVKLLNLTITNGRANDGGAITNNGKLTINNSVIKNSRSTGTGTNYGGAIYSTNTGTLTIINSTFSSNLADTNGGAIYADGNVTIIGSTFSSNTATQDGGAIYTNSNLYITNSSFTSNTANMANTGAGGAICQGDSSTLGLDLIISNSIFTSNRGQHGGALWTIAGKSTKPANIINTTFTSNEGTYGGAIRNWGYLNVDKSSFVSNSATEGSAINNYRNILTVTESNFINNAATTGGALYNAGGTSEIHFNRIIGNTGTDLYRAAGTLNAQNNWWGNNLQGSNPLTAGRVNANVNTATWLVLNLAPSNPLIKVGAISTITADLRYDNTGAYYNPSLGHVPDGIPVSFSATLGSINSPGSTVNGVSTVTFTAGSKPGVAVVNATMDAQTVNTTVTIGRDDVYVSPTGNDTTGDGSASNPFKTIATGIAGLYPGGTIHIANGTYNERNLTINKNMTIVGGSASSTIVDAQKLGRIFNITSGSTVTITNLTLKNGNVTGNGGAIINAGNLTIIGTNLLNNTATGTGGTIYNTGNAAINFNRIIGEGIVIASPSGSVNATNNWWGSNADPIGKVSTNVNVSKWLVLNESASPTLIKNGGVSTITADLTHDNTGVDTSSQGHLPDGIPIGFAGILGSIGPSTTINGRATATFTAGSKPGTAVVNATVDAQTVNTTVTIGRDDVYVSPTGNDVTGDGSASNPFKTIATGIAGLYPGGTIHIANGTYNEHDIIINKNMTIVGVSTSSTIIDAQKLGRIFNITSGSTVVITNLTLVNGSVTGNGGAIYNAGNLTLSGSDFRNNTATATGGTLYNTGSSNIYFNRIIGTNNVIASPSGSVIANNNWWDSNSNPSSKISGNVIASNWIILTVTSSKNNVTVGGTSSITANLIHDNTGAYLDPSLGHVFDGIDITFKVTDPILGIVNPKVVLTVNGSASTIFTGVNNGVSNISVSQDEETQNISIKVGTVNLWVTNYPWDSGVYTYNYKQQVVWLVQVNNLGNSTATGINVKFVVGKGFKVVSYNLIQPGTLTFDAVSNTFTWIIDRLEGGNNTPMGSFASFSVLLEPIKVGSGGGDFRFNSSIESCDQQNIGTTKSRVRNLVINPAADVQVNQTVSSNNPKNGDYVTITVRVKNNGPSNASNVSIYDLIPSGLYVGSLDSNTSIVVSMGNYNQTSGVWDILSLNNGTEAILTIVARVDAIAGTQITNRAYRSNTPLQYDWNTGNDATDFNLVVID